MDRIEKIKAMLRHTPQDGFLQHALALEYIKQAKDAEAKEAFETLLQQDENYIGSYYHLAKLLERTGDIKSAVCCYEKGMAIARKAGDLHTLGELQSAYEDLVG